jgi:hypothetical protein
VPKNRCGKVYARHWSTQRLFRRFTGRGYTVSSAILYLAIVAIWALVLVPRWLHPRSSLHRPSATLENEVPAPEGEEHDEAPATAEAPAGKLPAPSPAAASPSPAAAAPSPVAASPSPAAAAPSSVAAAPSSVAAAPSSVAAGPSASARHGQMLQARRRTLGTLVLLTLAAVVLAVTHLSAAWIIAPPALMLAGFIVLLREAALIDAERRRRTTQARHSAASSGAGAPGPPMDAAARHAETPSGPVAPAEHGTGGTASPATSRPGQPDTAAGLAPTGTYGHAPGTGSGPDAHVIDISERIDGQFYDQYTDAVDRAVGD